MHTVTTKQVRKGWLDYSFTTQNWKQLKGSKHRTRVLSANKTILKSLKRFKISRANSKPSNPLLTRAKLLDFNPCLRISIVTAIRDFQNTLWFIHDCLPYSVSSSRVLLSIISLILLIEKRCAYVPCSKYLHKVPEDYEYRCSKSRNLSSSPRDTLQVNGCSKATGTAQRWRTGMLEFQTLGTLSVPLKKT